MLRTRVLLPFVWLLSIVLFSALGAAESPDAGLDEYLARQGDAASVAAEVEARFGKPFAAFTGADYARFLAELDLGSATDLGRWSQVTGIPVVAVSREAAFFRANAHLLADGEAAAALTAEDLAGLASSFGRAERVLRIRDGEGRELTVRDVASKAIRTLDLVGQVRHNPEFAEDRTVPEALAPYLAPLASVGYLADVGDALRSLPLPVVKALRGKAIYLGTRPGAPSEAVWHAIGTDLYPGYGGMQPGVFVGAHADGSTADALVRALGRLVRETVLESQYFGLYAYPLQFPAFQSLQPDRRRTFGRRRDRLPAAGPGFFSDGARAGATESFVEHFRAFVRERESFLARAREEEAAGHPALMAKYRFMERLAEGTPATMERLTPGHIARVNAARQREILDGYLARQAEGPAVVAAVAAETGKPFVEFTAADYARFLGALDLNRDDDLWKWSHFTGIPIAALSRRSTTFHLNAHLLADAEAANLMSYEELTKLVTTYDPEADRVRITAADGRELEVRDLPAGTVVRTETSDGVVHNPGFVEDRMCYEALESYLVALDELENREEISEGIRLLPLSVVMACRGKALYPTTLSRTGWAVTWRVSNDRTVSYVGMMSGSFIEPRRDPMRAPFPPSELVARGVESLRGSAADSLVHEVGHVIDHSVIGGRRGVASFPWQYPEFQKLLEEKNRIFGAGDSRVPQTTFGYVSRYARANAQENFAESFWAFLRDREGFRARAEREEADGHPGLTEQFRFLEKLVEHTPYVPERLSPEYFAARRAAAAAAPVAAARAPALDEYLGHLARRDAVVAEVEKEFGKPFAEFTPEDYARFMDGLDLSRSDDLWRWSHATDIPLLAVRKGSDFFYVNLHLLADGALADRLRRSRVKTEYDPETKALTVRDEAGEALPLRDLPEGVIRPTGRTGRFWHLEGFETDRLALEALGPWLLRLDDLDYRAAIGEWVRSLPLTVVKIYGGKGIWFTTETGRSYAVGMPCSNAVYKIFVGLVTGVFVDPRRDGPAGTHQNFVHEIGHLADYAVLKGGYGTYRHPYQFPEFRKAMVEKEIVFGRGDDRVPQTPYGYFSRYAMTNAQESFAEHFRAIILEREKFRVLAEKEAAEGHPELREKYDFMERLLERTPTTMERLSADFLAREERWTALFDQLTRLGRARRELGEAVPASLDRLIEDRRAGAFAAAADDRSYGKALVAVARDVARMKDRERAGAVLAALSGLTLDLAFAPDATSARPALVAKLRGADAGDLRGTVTLGEGKPKPVEVAAGATAELVFEPAPGKDDGPFLAGAIADLKWGDQRLTLRKEIVVRPSIPVWWAIGPFDNPGGATEDRKHPPETEPVDLTKTHLGQGGATLAWREVRRDPESKPDAELVLDFDALFGEGKNAAACAVVWVHSAMETDAVVSLGSADGVVVRVNGERKFEWLGGRRDYRSRQDTVPIRLRKGANEILVKVTVTGNGWRFAAHLTDAEGRPLAGVRFGARR